MQRTKYTKNKLGDTMIKHDIITAEQLQEAEEAHQKTGGLFGQVLMDMGLVSESDIASAIALQYGLPVIQLADCALDDDVKFLISHDIMRKYDVVPFDVIGDIMSIAIAGPINVQAIDALEKETGKELSLFCTTPTSLRMVQKLHFGVK